MFKKIEVSEDTFKKLNFLKTYWNYSNPNMVIERMIRHYSENHHIHYKPVANAISKCSSG